VCSNSTPLGCPLSHQCYHTSCRNPAGCCRLTHDLCHLTLQKLCHLTLQKLCHLTLQKLCHLNHELCHLTLQGAAGNGLPGSCPAGELQFAEPIPGLSSLWSSWLWCDAPRTPTEKATLAALHDGTVPSFFRQEFAAPPPLPHSLPFSGAIGTHNGVEVEARPWM
jgi:hypothetical protein